MNPKIKEALKNVEAVQRSFRAYGAKDTEPDGEIHHIIRCAVQRKSYPFEDAVNKNRYQLYSSMEGVHIALTELNNACKELYDVVLHNALDNDVEELKQFCWRVYW